MSLGAAETFGIALMATWGTAGAVALGRSVAKSPASREFATAFRKMNLASKCALVAGLAGAVAIGGTKPAGRDAPTARPPGGRFAETSRPAPPFALVEVRTNGVAFRVESASAVEIDALLDRMPGRRVAVQAELRPSGDFTYRYDFTDTFDPPATNLVIGAQVGTNGVNALAILGTNLLAETVWRVDGARETNGVSIADLLCTNGVLRTPTRFAIEWKNASGLSPNADTDGDGLSDWDDSSVTDDDDLVSLSIVLVQDSPVGGTVSVSPVSSTTAMRVWTDRAKTTPLTFPVEWAVSASPMFESTVYLEGGTPSASLSGTGLRAEFVPETGESTAETTFSTTVVKASRIESPGAPTTGLAVLAGTSVPFRIALIPAGMETASIVVWKTARRKFDGGYRPWTNIMQSFSSTATTYGFPNPGIYRVSADVTVCGAATRTVHYLRTGRDPYDAPKIERWNHVGVAATQRQLALREFALGRLGSTQFAFKGTLLAYNGFSSIRKPPT